MRSRFLSALVINGLSLAALVLGAGNAYALTATTLVGAPTANPAVIGQNTTIKATVSPAAASGVVTFKEGAATLGTGTLSAGVATLVTKFPSSGVHTLTAVYAGNTTYSASTSAAFSQNVSPITGSWGRIAVEGGSFTVGTNQVVRYGAGTTWFQKIVTGAGTCSNAFFGLDPIPKTVKECMVIAGTATSVALTSSVNPSAVAQSSTLVARVTPAVNSGTVTFKDGATVLGTAVAASGVATLSRSFSTTGAHSLTAVYAGTPTYATSTSAAVTHTVTATTSATLPAPPVSPTPVVSYEYDAEGNPTRTTLAPGVTGFGLASQVTYDPLARPKDVIDANTGATRILYDGADRPTSVTDPRGLQTQYPRNGLGDVQKVVSPDTGTASLATDAAGNVTRRTDSRGTVAVYSYDGLDRLTRATYSPAAQPSQPTQTYQWVYDQTGTGFSHGIGRLTSTAFPEGSTRTAYDPQGRVVTATQTLNPATGANHQTLTLTTGYTYGPAGDLASVTYPSGRVVTTTYANGLPSALNLAAAAGATPTPLLTAIAFAPFGGAQSWNWAMASGAVAHARVFDASGRPVRYPLGRHLRDLGYDAAGRITGYTHYLQATATTGSPATALNQQFSYDKVGRLTRATQGTNSWAYTYDANGNRTSVALDSAAPAANTIAATSNRLIATAAPAATLAYDAAGSITGDGNGMALGYDLRQRLTTLTSTAGITRYSYDAAGQRVRKAGPVTGTVVYVYDPQGQLLGEYDGTGRAIREYVWLGNTPVAVFTPQSATSAPATAPAIYFLHTDHLGAPRIAVDRSNQVRWSWLAEPFGTTPANAQPTAGLPATEISLRLPGQLFDAESGLHYNYFRDYFPGAGRYVQSDPIGLAGGINTYGYVGGNPVSNTDPLGLYAQGAAVICGPFAIGCAVAITGAMAMSTPGGQSAAMNLINKVVDMCKPAIADVSPNDLCEKLALEEAKAGAGVPIMGEMGDAARLVAQYGSGPWIKKQHTHQCSDGRKLVIHYFSNGKVNVELKFK